MSADPTGERQEYAQAAEASVPVSEIEALADCTGYIGARTDQPGDFWTEEMCCLSCRPRLIVARARGEQA